MKSHEIQKKNWYSSSVDKARVIATYFGFEPSNTPQMLPHKKGDPTDLIERESVLAHYFNEHISDEPQPVMFSYERPMQKSGIKKERGHVEIGLEIIGTADATAEGMMISAMRSILEEAGHKSIILEINTIGDKESTARLERELGAYVRKHISALPSALRESFKQDIWNVVRMYEEKNADFFDNAPQTLNALSDISKLHFKSVLEFVEGTGMTYTVQPRLVLPKEYAIHTIGMIWEVDASGKKDKKPLATFFRYNHVAKGTEFKKELPALTGSLSFKPKWQATKPIPVSKLQKPQHFFVQLGKEAKVAGTNVFHMLAHARIMVGHAMMRDKIAAQMMQAERLRVPFILLMGQREAIDKSIVLRDTVTRSQETIKLSELVNVLKKKSKKK